MSGYCHCADSQGRELAETGRPTSGHATGREGRSPSPYLQSSSSSAHLLPASLWGVRRRAWSANVTRAPLSTAAAGPRGALRPLGRGTLTSGRMQLRAWQVGHRWVSGSCNSAELPCAGRHLHPIPAARLREPVPSSSDPMCNDAGGGAGPPSPAEMARSGLLSRVTPRTVLSLRRFGAAPR